MKRADTLYIVTKMLEESQAKEKASTERANLFEKQLAEALKQVAYMQKLLEKNTTTIEKLMRELKLLRPKQCERIMNSDSQADAEGSSEKQEEKAESNSSEENKENKEAGSGDKESTPSDSRWGNARKRGNNGAKRKEYFCTEVQKHDIWPETEGFSPEAANVIRTIDQIRYEYIPPRFIKHIYHLRICKIQDRLLQGKGPLTPFQNSSFSSSFIAGMLQLRYGYSLPVERIIRLFGESGFDIDKSTAHSLLAKAYTQLEDLDEVLKAAVLEDSYINMDESYFTALEIGPRATDDTLSSKVYVWCAQARHLNLIHFFTTRGQEVPGC